MKHLLTAIVISLLFALPLCAQNIPLGSGKFYLDQNDFTPSQQATTLQIVGTDSGSSFYGTFSTPIVLATKIPTYLTLTGTLNGTNPGSSFTITFYDDQATPNQLVYGAYWADFIYIDTPLTIALNQLSADAAFNGNIALLGLNTGGMDSNTLNFTFSSLDAIPEPSCLPLLVAGCTVLGCLSHRFKGGRKA